jgi:hypothetical protein
MPGEYHAGDCYLEITFLRAYSGIELAPGRIRVPFMDVASARQALREMKTEITHEINIVAGEVLSDPPAIQGSVVTDTGEDMQLASQKPEDHEPCPDGGACHHGCNPPGCFRVHWAGPLSSVFPGDKWPDDVVASHPESGVL